MLLRFSKFVCTTFASLLFAVSIAYSAPDTHRFDQLLKTSWYGVYMGDAKVGYMKTSLDKIEAPVAGWRMEAQMTLAMKMGAVEATMTIHDTRIFKSPDGGLDSSSFVISSPNGDISVEGQTRGDRFVMTSNIGGQVTEKEYAAPFDYLDSVLCTELHVLSGKAAVGDSFDFALFEPTPPLTGLVHQHVRISGKEDYFFNGVAVDAFLYEMTVTEAGVTARGRIDKYGNTLEANLGAGMVMRLEGEALAKHLDEAYDIISGSLVIPRGKITNPSALNRLTLKISGIDTSQILTNDIQKVSPDTDGVILEIARQEEPTGMAADSPLPPGIDEDLKSEPLIQSDDLEIKELAKEIVGHEKNRWHAAIKINDWVYNNIEKRYSPDFSNALQTLNTRKGDCGEHTALAVALLRAAGIPARPIAGLVYWPPGNGFGYHAWTEVYAGRWVEMDPTWGEELANPSHIALAHGDIIEQVRVLYRVMGNIKIDILDAN